MDFRHDNLADKAERGELQVKSGTIRRGEASRTETQRLLMEATDTSAVEDAMRIAVGRPAVGTERGSSPIVRARVPQALKDQVAALAAEDHRKESDIVRDALTAYVRLRTAS